MARIITPAGGPIADLDIAPETAPEMLADALVRHMFAISMDLHGILGRVSAPAGGTGRSQPAIVTPAAHLAAQRSVHLHPDSEQLRRILHEAIAELDHMVHQTRLLVFAHLDSTTPAEPGAV
ncbi:hypothetical protein AB0H37_09040 [Actinomadura sp. NPDC023710]|uniref:hypothetical protein n=1 Tax=Actinomadura sp. NPDC023710 TaxID=3158219 RepID=UPI0033FD1EA5